MKNIKTIILVALLFGFLIAIGTPPWAFAFLSLYLLHENKVI
jgi:hypothetical protein